MPALDARRPAAELSAAQRRQTANALELAQEVRLAGAALKDAVHADPSWRILVDVLTGDLDVEHADSVRVGLLLTAAPGIGPAHAAGILRAAGVPAPRRRLGDLSRRQRTELAAEVLRNRRGRSDTALARFAQTPRHYYQRAHA